jgi:ubiquitin conjugation factor E4 B
MLKWIALALESNNEHNKERANVSIAASRGFMLNLAAVMLKICDPFLEPSTGKAWGKLDARYRLRNFGSPKAANLKYAESI